jgi:type I restriction enzyme S subunit
MEIFVMPSDRESSITTRIYKSYPNDWIVQELGSLLRKIKRPVDVTPEQEYQEIGIRSHGKGLFHKKPVKGNALGNKAVFWVEENSLILNIVFAWEQAVAITGAQEQGMIASHRFPMWQSRGKVDLNYLLMFLLTPLGRHFLELTSPGGAGRNKTLGQDDFRRIPVCIPRKLEEQQKIVKIITTWEKVITLKEQLIEAKKKQKNWLMQNLLTGKKRLPGFEGTWMEVLLGDVCTLNDHSLSEYTDPDCGFWYIDLSSVEAGKITHPSFPVRFAQLPSRARRVFQKDDILLSTVRPYLLGFAYIDKEYSQYVCSTGFAVVRAKEDICPKFIYHNLFSDAVVNQMNRCLMGTNYPAMNHDDVYRLRLNLPPLLEQKAIAEILSAADREIDLLEKELEELKKQKRALRQLLLTGAVRVHELEVS